MRQYVILLVVLLFAGCSQQETASQDSTEALPETQVSPASAVPLEESSQILPEQQAQETPTITPPPELQTPSPKPPAPGPSSLGTRTMKTGIFDGKHVSGRVSLFKKTDGSRVVSIESFYVEPAANLHIYLAEDNPAEGIDLGRLVSKQGAQQYNVPSDLNAARIKQIVIYNPEKELVWGSAVLT